jgi:hypothetical protein
MEPEGRGSRQRITIAIAAGVLVAIVAVVAIVGGGDGEERVAPPLPAECVRAWNDDQPALAYGRHNFNFHLYRGALVVYLDRDAVETSAEAGSCAVVFPSEVLDAEPIAAGQILNGKRWDPLSSLEGVDLNRVAELQVAAAAAPNAELDTAGQLSPL